MARSPGKPVPVIRRVVSNQPLLWGAFTLCSVLAFAGLGTYSKLYMHRDFLGERTKILHKCREHPNFNRSVCEELLMARGEVGRLRASKVMRGLHQAPFQLGDAEEDSKASSR